MDSRTRQIALLRSEVARVWRIADDWKRKYQDHAAMSGAEMGRLHCTIEQQNATIADLEQQLRQCRQELAVHENYNNSTRDARLYAEKRRKFHKQLKQNAGSPGDAQQPARKGSGGGGAKRDTGGGDGGGGDRRGRRQGAPGVSHHHKSEYTKRFIPDMCGQCGGTYLQPHETTYKPATDTTPCNRQTYHTEEIVTVLCLHCGAVTIPDSDTLPGSWCGPNLRGLISNIHDVTPSIAGIRKLLKRNHNTTISAGAISHCITAMALRAEHGNAPQTSGGDIIMGDGGRPPIPYGAGAPYDASTVWSCMASPIPLMETISEWASMAPHVQFDESHANVAGSRAQALVLLTPKVVIIRVVGHRDKETIQGLFWMVLSRPLVADKYRGGNAFVGGYQTCMVHLERHLESFAIDAGDGSLEQTLYLMFDDIRKDAKMAAAHITEMAGGPMKSACEIGRAMLNPRIRQHVEQQRTTLSGRVEKIAHAYATGAVTIPDSRRMSGSLERAEPYLFTNLEHPGMENNSNNVERTIRQHHVRPRNTQRILPDWNAARNAGILRSIYATCELNDWAPGDIFGARRMDDDPFSSGIPPPILSGARRDADGSSHAPVRAGRSGPPSDLV